MSNKMFFAGIPVDGTGNRPLEADLYAADAQGIDAENISATGNLNIGQVIDYDSSQNSDDGGADIEQPTENMKLASTPPSYTETLVQNNGAEQPAKGAGGDEISPVRTAAITSPSLAQESNAYSLERSEESSGDNTTFNSSSANNENNQFNSQETTIESNNESGTNNYHSESNNYTSSFNNESTTNNYYSDVTNNHYESNVHIEDNDTTIINGDNNVVNSGGGNGDVISDNDIVDVDITNTDIDTGDISNIVNTEQLLETTLNIVRSITDVSEGPVNTLTQTLNETTTTLLESSALQTVVEIIEEVADLTGGMVGIAGDNITNILTSVDNATDNVSNIIDEMVTTVTDTVSTLSDSTVNPLVETVSMTDISQTTETLLDGVDDLLSSEGADPGGLVLVDAAADIFNPEAQPLADDGILANANISLLSGESDAPEAADTGVVNLDASLLSAPIGAESAENDGVSLNINPDSPIGELLGIDVLEPVVVDLDLPSLDSDEGEIVQQLVEQPFAEVTDMLDAGDCFESDIEFEALSQVVQEISPVDTGVLFSDSGIVGEGGLGDTATGIIDSGGSIIPDDLSLGGLFG